MAEQLPIVAYKPRGQTESYLFNSRISGFGEGEAMTPHAPAQSALDELRAENAALKEKLQEQALQALSDDGQWIEHSGTLAAERDELRREVEALREDRDRRNKLIEKLTASLEECVEDTVDVINNYIATYGEHWRPARLNALRDQESRARAAIDTARASTDEGVGK